MKARLWAVILTALFGVVLAWYLFYTQQLVSALRSDAQAVSHMYAHVLEGIAAGPEGNVTALFDLLGDIERLGIPVILIAPSGQLSAAANLPFDFDLSNTEDQKRILEFIKVLDRRNPPIVEEGIGEIHFGAPAVVERLRWVPWTQAATLVVIVLAAVWIVRSTVSAEREHVWATMAREAAHQLGTPLSSLAGWVEILRMKADERAEVAPDEMIAREVEVDVDRLNKVAQRFELIGLQPQMQSVSIVDVLRKLQKYFSVRLPRQQNAIRLEIDYVPDIPKVIGNPVLLEWAFENIIKNSIDVLAGRGGNILIKVRTVDAKVHIHFCDDGPGVAPEVGQNVFEAGVSGKGGWGVGLTLTRRIIKVTHRGSITLGIPDQGAEFIVELPAAVNEEAEA